MQLPMSVGEIVLVTEPDREAIPKLTSFYGRFEPLRIAAGRDIAELEDRLILARARQVWLTRSVSRFFLAAAFRNAASALAGTDLDSFEEFNTHARRHRATLADWMREQDLFTSPDFFIPVPDGIDTSRAPRFPDYRPSVGSVFGGAAPDLTLLLAANGLAFFLGLRWFVRRQIG